MNRDDLLTTVEAAAIIGIAEPTVRRRLRLGQLSGKKIGPHMWVVERGEAERAAAEGRLKAGRKPGRAPLPPAVGERRAAKRQRRAEREAASADGNANGQ